MVLPFWRGSGPASVFSDSPHARSWSGARSSGARTIIGAARVRPEDYIHPTPFGKIKSFSIERVR